MLRQVDRVVTDSLVLKSDPKYRTAIGVLGISLPLILIVLLLVLGEGLLNSLSLYYYTVVGDWFVGTLFVIGVFLFFYTYETNPQKPPKSRIAAKGRADTWLGKIAGVGAVLVALLPTTLPEGSTPPPIVDEAPAAAPFVPTIPPEEQKKPPIIGTAHGYAAAVTFVALSLFPLLLFSQSSEKKRLYKACGYVMLVCVVLIGIYAKILPDAQRDALGPLRPILWLETVLIVVFGISWFVKGKEVGQARPVASV